MQVRHTEAEGEEHADKADGNREPGGWLDARDGSFTKRTHSDGGDRDGWTNVMLPSVPVHCKLLPDRVA